MRGVLKRFEKEERKGNIQKDKGYYIDVNDNGSSKIHDSYVIPSEERDSIGA